MLKEDLQRWSVGSDVRVIGSPSGTATPVQNLNLNGSASSSQACQLQARPGAGGTTAENSYPLGSGAGSIPSTSHDTGAGVPFTSPRSGITGPPTGTARSQQQTQMQTNTTTASPSVTDPPALAAEASVSLKRTATGTAAWLGSASMTKFPSIWIALTSVVFIGLTLFAATFLPEKWRLAPDPEDLEAFLNTDDNETVANRALEAAADVRDWESADCLPFDLFLIYQMTSESTFNGMFDLNAMRKIANFEQSLRSLSRWSDLCPKTESSSRNLCNYGISFVNYALPSLTYPSDEVVPSALVVDGEETTSLNMDTVLHLLERRNIDDLVFPKDFDYSSRPSGPEALRSAFRFTPKCNGERAISRPVWEDLWKGLLTDQAMDYLRQGIESEGIKVYFSGTGVEALEVSETMKGDRWVVLGAWFIVFLALAIQMRRLFVIAAGIFSILLPIPMIYVLVGLITDNSALTVPLLMTSFIAPLITLDAVMLSYDLWLDSRMQSTSQFERLQWTAAQAWKSNFVSLFLLIIFCLLHLFSAVRFLRELGVYMSLYFAFSSLNLLLIFTPACLVDDRRCGRCCIFGRKPQSFLKTRKSYDIAKHIVVRVFQWRFTFCLVPALLAVSFGYFALWQWDSDPNIANIFPKTHNMNEGLTLAESFVNLRKVMPSSLEPMPLEETVCSPTSDSTTCAFSWCEALSRDSAPQTCTCYRQQSECSPPSVKWVYAKSQFVGLSKITSEEYISFFSPHLLPTEEEQENFQVTLDSSAITNTTRPPLLLQVWETSAVEFAPVTQVAVKMVRSNMSASSCGWKDYCYCLDYACAKIASAATEATSFADIAVGMDTATWEPSSTTTSSSSSSALSSETSAVNVVFGFDLRESTDLIGQTDMESMWSYKGGFYLSDPNVQRALYTFCTELPESLRVTTRHCWIEDFRTYLLDREERFPTAATTFFSFLQLFLAQEQLDLSSAIEVESITMPRGSEAYLWQDSTSVRGCVLSFEVDVDISLNPSVLNNYKKEWNNYVSSLNDNCQDCGGAVHVSDLWEKANSHRAFLESATVSIGFAGIVAVLVLSFTFRALLLAFFSLVTCMGSIAVLAFFMVVVVNWDMGQVQVISLLIAAMYAMHHCIHLIQMYSSDLSVPDSFVLALSTDMLSSMRVQRVGHAVRAIGRTTMVSAIVMFACGSTLAFCGITLLRDVGFSFMILAPIVAIAVLMPLPAGLLMSGPDPGTRCCSALVHKGDSSSKDEVDINFARAI